MCEFFCTFADDLNTHMRKIFLIIVLFGAFVTCAHAETLLLRTGARVRGTIVFQNEEVVIIRDAEGARFQYPRADVEQILSDESESPDASDASESSDSQEITVNKKASILLELAGGAAVIPGEKAGGAVSADLLVGSHHIGDKHLFVGGGVRVAGTTDERQAVCRGLGSKVRVLEKQFGIERGGSHLLAVERLGIRPVVGLVLVAIGGLEDAEEFALGDVRLLAEDLAGSGLNGVLIRYLGHSCWGF